MKKISYECRAYELVDNRSLSWAIFQKIYGKNNSGHKGLSICRAYSSNAK